MIRGDEVPAFGPESFRKGVTLLVMGEAPGRLGADYSGLPFWGDRSGDIIWGQLLKKHGFAFWDGDSKPSRWKDGQLQKIRPKLRQVAITNAYNRCPVSETSKRKIQKPTRSQINEEAQLKRRSFELKTLKPSCIWTVGQCALYAFSQHVDSEVDDHGSERIKKLLKEPSLKIHGSIYENIQMKEGFSTKLLFTAHCSPLVINSRFKASPDQWMKPFEKLFKGLSKGLAKNGLKDFERATAIL
jgi:uracil-DNA glycosylase